MRSTLLVTNDFPPKVGGIQNYLWELCRRLPSQSLTVLTTPHLDAAAFDAAHPVRVVRDKNRVLLPHAGLRRRIRQLADEVGAELVLLDPALPLGWLGPKLGVPYGLVLHGAEVALPANVVGPKHLLRRVLRGADLVVAAGHYVAAAASRCAGAVLPVVEVPPGVDASRFVPLSVAERDAARARYGLPAGTPLVVGLSRLVPRKGYDRAIQAVAKLSSSGVLVHLAVAGTGRDSPRLRKLITRTGAPATLLGEVPNAEVPAVAGMGDLFVMACRNRWGGLEQEGFGIVFLEAAAAGVPSVAGRSGGSHEAVAHGRTGLVVDHPEQAVALADAIGELLSAPTVRQQMGRHARTRAAEEFDYDILARRLEEALS